MSSSQENPNGLLLFSIGPVQDFIATARRTQDLWMGSYILAYLSYVAMESIQKKMGYDPKKANDGRDPILFPVLDDHPFPKGKAKPGDRAHRRQLTIASLPNKFTVRIDSVEQGEKFARMAQKRVYEVWEEISASVQAKIPGTLQLNKPFNWSQMWQEQTEPENWLEIYWVVYPNPNQQDDFGDLNKKAERALQARKGVRNFKPVAEVGERDSLSGRRAALSDPRQQPRRDLRAQWQDLAEALYKEGIKTKPTDPYSGLSAALSTEGHEYLSAIGMTKRFAQRFCFQPHWGLEGKFPSTSSIASAVFRQKLLDNSQLKAARDKFVIGLRSVKGTDGHLLPETLSKDSLPLLFAKHKDAPLLEYDGELFYPDTYTEKRLKDDFNVPFTETAVTQLKQNLLALRSAAKSKNIGMPPTYYALLFMDGDKLGDHLTKIDDIDGQRDVSHRLMRFALQEVQTIVEDTHLGRVVYAGGDDLMAFLPLENVLAAAEALNEAYRQTLNIGDGHHYTASAGIAIAHHLAPLDRVLEAARAAEKLAKGWYGRDSIAFSILKRSGEQLDVGSHWNFADEHAVLPIIQTVRDHLQSNEVDLSPKFAFDAQQEAAAIAKLPAAHEKRLALLLQRHSKKLAETDRVRLAAALSAIGQGIHTQLNNPGQQDADDGTGRKRNRLGTVETAHWLLLARFLVAAMAGEE
ncbi:MAG: type III-B CRISPR-associated protein Cas10/Cmr2 [Chloroflexi bacterium]|nr:type III-B CRISPR-associated protein Cas10/Cmr2 [Chloroflexota bacterium]